MCGRYALFSDPDELAAEFDLDDASYEATYNAAPSEELPVILDENSTEFSTARWGLVPSWSEGPKDGPDPINARAESLTENRLFAEAYEQRRCLVPADGFYEWTETDDGKQPYFVSRADGRPLLLAGLWETWTPEQKQTGLGEFGSGGPSREAEPVQSFTIVTTEPNDFLADYHHRMAVVLDPEAGERWLSAEDPGDLLEPSTIDFEAWPVSEAVNNPANDRPELVEPVA
ncbi:SOS response-associated peptidase [Halobacterium sp. NMX12-1]|uniref:SOS response-associated peptidase n=1 Tax=Halobacterium sp. NMX12-1 TaxID=3166650 RepID=A0AAU8C917_9EURY